MNPSAREPIFGDIPAVVPALGALVILVSAIVILGPPEPGNWIMGLCAVQIGPAQLPRPWGPWPPFVLHVFVHGGWLHLSMNVLGLLAFGPPVARWLRADRGLLAGALVFLLVFFLSAMAGALAQTLVIVLGHGGGAVLVGASGGLMGLIGVLVRLDYGRTRRPLPLTSRKVIAALVPWVVLNVLIGVFGAPGVSAPIAWPAHLGGLFAGVAMAGWLTSRR